MNRTLCSRSPKAVMESTSKTMMSQNFSPESFSNTYTTDRFCYEDDVLYST